MSGLVINPKDRFSRDAAHKPPSYLLLAVPRWYFSCGSICCLLLMSVLMLALPFVCALLKPSGNLFLKELFTMLTICSLCDLSICNLSYFPLWFQVQDFGSDCTRANIAAILESLIAHNSTYVNNG